MIEGGPSERDAAACAPNHRGDGKTDVRGAGKASGTSAPLRPGKPRNEPREDPFSESRCE